MRVVRFADVGWEPRTEDEWPCLVKRQLADEEADVVVRTVWYARDVVEPRHVHDGSHAAVILIGAVVVDGKTLGPGDVVYGPGGHPHGPLRYPYGSMLFALLQGGAHHTAVADAPTAEPVGMPPQFISEASVPWERRPGGEHKVIVRDRGRGYACAALRWAHGTKHRLPGFEGACAVVLLSGGLTVEGRRLEPWDLVYVRTGDQPVFEAHADCTAVVSVGGELAL